MSTSRILIFGAGAIGSLLGHRLASSGHSVTLIGRAGLVHAVRERGLLLETAGADKLGRPARPHPGTDLTPPMQRTEGACDEADTAVAVAHPAVAERLDSIPPDQRGWDLALLTVKVYDTSHAAQALGAALPETTPVLLVQNGVGGEELAAEVLGRSEVISGVMTLSVSALGPGHIRLETTKGGLSLAPTAPGQQIEEWAALFAKIGIRTAVYPDYRSLKWSKLLLNILANAIPAILDITPAEVFATPRLFAMEKAAFLEALTIMRAMQLKPVAFGGYPVPLLAWAMERLPDPVLRSVMGRLIASGRGGKRPSLQIDLSRRRQQSEALYLNGAVVSHAAALGLDAPTNAVVLDKLMGIAEGTVPWEAFRGRPQELYRAVEAEKG